MAYSARYQGGGRGGAAWSEGGGEESRLLSSAQQNKTKLAVGGEAPRRTAPSPQNLALRTQRLLLLLLVFWGGVLILLPACESFDHRPRMPFKTEHISYRGGKGGLSSQITLSGSSNDSRDSAALRPDASLRGVARSKYLVLQLLLSAVGVVLQLNQLLLAHAYDLASLAASNRPEALPYHHRNRV